MGTTTIIKRQGAAFLLLFGLTLLGSTGCSGGDGKDSDVPKLDYPGTEQGAKDLLKEFVKPGADHAKLSKALQPATADYGSVYDADFAKKLEAAYEPAWKSGDLVVKPKDGQTEVLVWGASAEDLKAGKGNAAQFPGGYRQVAPMLKDGVTLYFFKFVEPGKNLGMAYDGLVHVNGKWRIMPKPFRIK